MVEVNEANIPQGEKENQPEHNVRVVGAFFFFSTAWTDLGWPCTYEDSIDGPCKCARAYRVYLSQEELEVLFREIPDAFEDGVPKPTSDRIKYAIMTRSIGRAVCKDHELMFNTEAL